MQKGHLYIIQSEEGPVKIGVSIDPKSRIARLSATAGRYIVRQFISPPIAGYAELEAELHKHFRSQRSAGEWFDLDYREAVKVAHYLGAAHEPRSWTEADAYIQGVAHRKRLHEFSNPERTEAEWDAFFAGMGQEAMEQITFADQVDNEAMLKVAEKLDQGLPAMAVQATALGIQPMVPASVMDDLRLLRDAMDADLKEAFGIPSRLIRS